MAKKKPYYGKGTKEKVLLDFKYRPSSLAELSRLHGIMGSNTVADWIKKYGNLHKIDLEKMKQPPSPLSAKEKNEREKRQRTYEQHRISELEIDLDEAKLRVQFYACAIAVCSEATGIDLLKKIGELLSEQSAKES